MPYVKNNICNWILRKGFSINALHLGIFSSEHTFKTVNNLFHYLRVLGLIPNTSFYICHFHVLLSWVELKQVNNKDLKTLQRKGFIGKLIT